PLRLVKLFAHLVEYLAAFEGRLETCRRWRRRADFLHSQDVYLGEVNVLRKIRGLLWRHPLWTAQELNVPATQPKSFLVTKRCGSGLVWRRRTKAGKNAKNQCSSQ